MGPVSFRGREDALHFMMKLIRRMNLSNVDFLLPQSFQRISFLLLKSNKYSEYIGVMVFERQRK
jgi:hypothetical protein